MVVRKNETVPDIVTAGGPTVALRVPAHPVALALLDIAGIPVAAPSANRSTRLSPTTAEHVLRDLGGRIDMILDGGPATGGLESTVLDVTTSPPRLLRPGLDTPAQIEAVIGPIVRSKSEPSAAGEPRRSPGLMEKHYAPRAPLECVSGDGQQRFEELRRQRLRVGWLAFDESAAARAGEFVFAMPRDARAFAALLYARFHALEALDVDRILVELPPDGEEWLAVHDRLRRASARQEY
jgi:L-threonylcarbamoyladenylate synthase